MCVSRTIPERLRDKMQLVLCMFSRELEMNRCWFCHWLQSIKSTNSLASALQRQVDYAPVAAAVCLIEMREASNVVSWWPHLCQVLSDRCERLSHLPLQIHINRLWSWARASHFSSCLYCFRSLFIHQSWTCKANKALYLFNDMVSTFETVSGVIDKSDFTIFKQKFEAKVSWFEIFFSENR